MAFSTAKHQKPKDKLSSALKLANEAVAELGGDAKQNAINKIDKFRNTIKSDGKNLWSRTKKRTRETAEDIDKKAHQRPYLFTGIVAGTVAALGLTLGAGIANAVKSCRK